MPIIEKKKLKGGKEGALVSYQNCSNSCRCLHQGQERRSQAHCPGLQEMTSIHLLSMSLSMQNCIPKPLRQYLRPIQNVCERGRECETGGER